MTDSPAPRGPRAVVGVLLALLATVSLTACGSSTPTAAPSPSASASSTPAAPPRIIPTSIDIPSIDAKSSLVQLGLNPDKSVEVPPVAQPLQAGWYKYSPTPGQDGPAVILGHIDGDHQEGIFWRLHEMKAGDKVMIGRQDGSTLTFTVSKVDEIAKSAFPTSAVYGNTPDPELRLITCGGAFDAAAHNYLDNIIVYATLSS